MRRHSSVTLALMTSVSLAGCSTVSEAQSGRAAPLPSLSSPEITVSESVGTAHKKVVRSGNASKAVSFSYRTEPDSATSPADFSARSGTLTIPKGYYDVDVPIPITSDTTHEGAERGKLVIFSPSNATIPQSTSYFNITDDDAPVVQPPQPIQCEDGSTVIPPATCPPVVQPPQPIQCEDGSTVIPPATCPPVVIPPQPIQCEDGSTVIPPATCPPVITPPPVTRDNVLASEGDSISVTWSGNHTGVYAGSRSLAQHCGLAVGGSTITTMSARISGVINCNPEVLTVLIGANDLYMGSPNPTTSDWLTKLWTYTDQAKAKGIKVAVGTILPQYHSNNPTYDVEFNNRRAEANAAIRTAVGSKIDAVIDFAADPVMGPDAAAKDLNLYKDGTHPTDACGYGCGGQGRLASIYAPVVDRLLGTAPPAQLPILGVAATTVREEDRLATVTATLDKVTDKPVLFSWWLTPGTAEIGKDFVNTSGDLTIQPGQLAMSFSFGIVDDTTAEQTESLTVNVQAKINAAGSISSAPVTITDGDTAPPPQTQCPDGSWVPSGTPCPTPPPNQGDLEKPNEAGDILSPGIEGLPNYASGFDPKTGIAPLNQYDNVTTAAPDVLGAERFICGPSHESYDDPVVFPGQPGKSHLHQFYGNTGANGNSTFQSLRTSGKSTCTYGNSPLNRSAYWMPAMLDGDGNIVRPDFVSIYYKRRPRTDPKCNPANPQAEGTCVDLPNGLRFVYGYDMLTGQAPTGGGYFNVQGTGTTPGKYSTIVQAAKYTVNGAQIGAIIEAPSCWDGKRLDSANHRDHVSYASYGTWGYLKCPPTHPYVIPTFTLAAWYTVDSTLDKSGTWIAGVTKTWSLASDQMLNMPPKIPGTTFHADWFGAWDEYAKDEFQSGGNPDGGTPCIDGLLNCSGGILSTKWKLVNANQPMYPNGTGGLTPAWGVPQQWRKVPIPARGETTRIPY